MFKYSRQVEDIAAPGDDCLLYVEPTVSTETCDRFAGILSWYVISNPGQLSLHTLSATEKKVPAKGR